MGPPSLEDAQSNDCFFLATMLAGTSEADMAKFVQAFLIRNPVVDKIGLVEYLHERGFVSYEGEAVMEAVDWSPPPEDGKEVAAWRTAWGPSPIPEGAPWYGAFRDSRGRRAKVAFLGSPTLDGTQPELARPSEILRSMWKLPQPNLCIYADAGSMHPKKLDAAKRMAFLPQYYEWVKESLSDPDGEKVTTLPNTKKAAPKLSSVVPVDEPGAPTPPDPDQGMAPATESKPKSLATARLQQAVRSVTASLLPGPKVKLSSLLAQSLEEWNNKLPEFDSDAVLSDSSINSIIYTKLREVFVALLDAAALAGSWIIVDRTNGQGSATAELMLEWALERGTSKPIVVVVDSLERLGMASEASRCARALKGLRDMFTAEDTVSQAPNGTELDFQMSYGYSVDDFEDPSTFEKAPDAGLPFPVLPEHQRRLYNNTCDPMRKWRYFYVDAIFSSATHIVIKNNDADEFNLEEVGECGFLYAHGDTRTFKRLRANIQKGKSTVLLYNSGGVTQAFGWLQRVMAFQRPPPDASELRGPLKFVISTLSRANWTQDFGVPEILMMRSLAERAPMLFRKSVISVDILKESEEQVLEAITGCFSQTGGVPELGVGNAEVNVIYNAWFTHMMLCENGRYFHRRAVALQTIVWTLGLSTVICSTILSSFGSGLLLRAMNELQWMRVLDAAEMALMQGILGYAILLLPILTALAVTVQSNMAYRDKWSVCVYAADTIASEIYKFRLGTLEYDQSQPVKDAEGNTLPPLSAKEKSRRNRMLFVERTTAFYQATVTEISQSSALRRRRRKVSPASRMVERTEREAKPTLAQWFKLKKHLERHFYRTTWALPQGVSFLTWISGLRPYLQQKSVMEEIRAGLTTLQEDGKITLRGKAPLTDVESRMVRHTLATNLGLPPTMLDSVKDEIRGVQRKAVLALAAEAERAEFEANISSGVDAGPEPMADEDDLREMVLDYAGLAPPKPDDEAIDIALKKRAKKKNAVMTVSKEVDDDYLAGPLFIDTYMVFRVRPMMEMLERRATKLSRRFTLLQILGFCMQSGGAFLGAFELYEWTVLSVAIASVVQGVIEYINLRDQVTSVNLALRDLNGLCIYWDALSIVRRRTATVKSRICDTAESAMLMVVDAHTTAASNAISSVSKRLAGEAADDAEEAADS